MATAEILVDETTNTQRRVETQHLDVDIGMADGDVMTDYPRQAMRFSNSGDSYNDSRFSSKSISQAGTSDNTENETLSELFSFGHEADKFNGKTIATFSSNLDTSDVYNTMSSRGIRVTKEDIEGAFGTLLKTTPSRCYYRCLRSLTLLILHVIAIVMIMLFILILTVLYFGFLSEGIPPWTTGSENDPPSFVLYCLLIVTLIALIATFFMVRRILHKAERAVNYDLLRYDIIVGYVRTSCCSEKGLHVVYFKSSKCLDTLERYLKAKQTKGKILESSGTSIEDSAANEYDTNDSEITPLLDTTDLESGTKEKARKTIAEICGDYVRKVNKQKLRNPVRGQRHTRQGLCLCQYVESEKFKEVV
ncbi:uncharacterized protein [Ptychodera flava]|uniref:uncharacterized protein isoform X3 n=1 Tax=Ptychodera flava TaxID=63121 RepID=UPI003969E8E3